MGELAERRAGAGSFPLEVGGLRAAEVAAGELWSVMPFRGDRGRELACGWPEPGRWVEGDGARAVWSGRDAVMVVGPRPEGLEGRAAVVEQTDAWVRVRFEGAGAEDVLARLVPVDLRRRAFPEGSVARTLLGHANVLILRAGGAFEVWAFRSMAGTLAHDLGRAMRGVAARGTVRPASG